VTSTSAARAAIAQAVQALACLLQLPQSPGEPLLDHAQRAAPGGSLRRDVDYPALARAAARGLTAQKAT
jgi:hypothetical protein